MAIALFTVGGLFGPMQTLTQALTQGRRKLGARRAQRKPQPRQAAMQLPLPIMASTETPSPTRVPARPLRVVRVFEGAQPRAAAGRMVISGRLADVCAELDRLAAAEAAAA